MSEHKALDTDQIRNLLSNTRTPKGLATEPRDIQVWFKQDHILREEGCDNPDCQDPRPSDDVGRRIVIKIKDEFICRTCFLNGYLSPNS